MKIFKMILHRGLRKTSLIVYTKTVELQERLGSVEDHSGLLHQWSFPQIILLALQRLLGIKVTGTRGG